EDHQQSLEQTPIPLREGLDLSLNPLERFGDPFAGDVDAGRVVAGEPSREMPPELRVIGDDLSKQRLRRETELFGKIDGDFIRLAVPQREGEPPLVMVRQRTCREDQRKLADKRRRFVGVVAAKRRANSRPQFLGVVADAVERCDRAGSFKQSRHELLPDRPLVHEMESAVKTHEAALTIPAAGYSYRASAKAILPSVAELSDRIRACRRRHFC